MKKERIERIIQFYANDYRDMTISEKSLKDMFEDFIETLECDHQCSSNCRKEGCNCACGNCHF